MGLLKNEERRDLFRRILSTLTDEELALLTETNPALITEEDCRRAKLVKHRDYRVLSGDRTKTRFVLFPRKKALRYTDYIVSLLGVCDSGGYYRFHALDIPRGLWCVLTDGTKAALLQRAREILLEDIRSAEETRRETGKIRPPLRTARTAAAYGTRNAG